MKRYIVVEGETDKRSVLDFLEIDSDSDISVIVAGGRTAAKTLGNSIAVAKQAPVAIVIDADTTSDERMRDEELEFQDLVSMLPVSTPPVIFLVKPNLETALQSSDEALDKLALFAVDDDYVIKNPFTLRR